MKAIIVLGSPNSPDGRLYNVALDRCNMALKTFKLLRNAKVLLTGGFGDHFNISEKSHAQLLFNYLTFKGIPPDAFLPFSLSRNTIEDAKLSKEVLLKYKLFESIVVTSDYHLDRAKFIFTEVYKNTGIKLTYQAVKTSTKESELNIEELIRHEKSALNKLLNYGIEDYY
ncbi:MAG: YdcF family protein [Prolixibacteraceae bacterium]|nr:YdcF family protein [Prolixibacteraceae bacterium]